MIIYEATKKDFVDQSFGDLTDNYLISFYYKATGVMVSASEQESWKTSIRWMRDVLRDPEIPMDANVFIEYRLPKTLKRIDFIIAGQDQYGSEHVVLIELKQWSHVSLSEKDGIVQTGFFGEQPHPSYQVWSYATLLEGFNTTVYKENVQLRPCAYLHNYRKDDVIEHEQYAPYLEKAPVFLEGDLEKERLQAFIKRFVKKGDSKKVMYRIEHGEIRPSKKLADSIGRMLKGNQEFVLIDDQKLAYEQALALVRRSTKSKKHILVIRGGPGTGKSLIAVRLLSTLLKMGLLTQYVSKAAAPRAVYESKLTGSMRKTEITNIFSGSGSFTDLEPNTFDVLLIDEAHRLNKKSGLLKNKGENQVKELIQAAACTVFFLDEDQKVTWDDIGELKEIEHWSRESGADLQVMDLACQFRCNGSDGYLSWLDQILQIRPTANESMEGTGYDFRVFDSVQELRNSIEEKNKESNNARIVAGYCWDWTSKKNGAAYDIRIPAENFSMRWNLASDGSLWILAPESVREAGCIHTCQGLELDHIGVIIGPDLIVRDGKVITRPEMRSKMDVSLKGYKKARKDNPEAADKKADAIIKNTYRTLMTRGMKSCSIYSEDAETRAYFRGDAHG